MNREHYKKLGQLLSSKMLTTNSTVSVIAASEFTGSAISSAIGSGYKAITTRFGKGKKNEYLLIAEKACRKYKIEGYEGILEYLKVEAGKGNREFETLLFNEIIEWAALSDEGVGSDDSQEDYVLVEDPREIRFIHFMEQARERYHLDLAISFVEGFLQGYVHTCKKRDIDFQGLYQAFDRDGYTLGDLLNWLDQNIDMEDPDFARLISLTIRTIKQPQEFLNRFMLLANAFGINGKSLSSSKAMKIIMEIGKLPIQDEGFIAYVRDQIVRLNLGGTKLVGEIEHREYPLQAYVEFYVNIFNAIRDLPDRVSDKQLLEFSQGELCKSWFYGFSGKAVYALIPVILEEIGKGDPEKGIRTLRRFLKHAQMREISDQLPALSAEELDIFDRIKGAINIAASAHIRSEEDRELVISTLSGIFGAEMTRNMLDLSEVIGDDRLLGPRRARGLVDRARGKIEDVREEVNEQTSRASGILSILSKGIPRSSTIAHIGLGFMSASMVMYNAFGNDAIWVMLLGFKAIIFAWVVNFMAGILLTMRAADDVREVNPNSLKQNGTFSVKRLLGFGARLANPEARVEQDIAVSADALRKASVKDLTRPLTGAASTLHDGAFKDATEGQDRAPR